MVYICDAEEWNESANVWLAVMDKFKWGGYESIILDWQIVGDVYSLLYGIIPITRWEEC